MDRKSDPRSEYERIAGTSIDPYLVLAQVIFRRLLSHHQGRAEGTFEDLRDHHTGDFDVKSEQD